MKLTLNEVAIGILGLMGCVLTGTWGASWFMAGKFASLEEKVAPIPALVHDMTDLKVGQAQQGEQIKAVQSDVAEMKKPLANTQGNAKLILDKVKKLKSEADISASIHRGPFGLAN